MKTITIPVVAAIVLSSLPALGQAKIGGSMLLLSPTTNKQITSVKVGRSFRVGVTLTDLHLIANRDTTFTYAISVLPTGSNIPVSITGKWSALVTLPKSEGGALKTRQELADLKGTQRETFPITVPGFMPAGEATLTVSVNSKGAGSLTLNKKLSIRL